MENDIEINTSYRVYELNNVMGSKKHQALERVEFKGFGLNSFETEQEAIEALIRDEKTYEDYIILKVVYLTK